MASSPNVLIIGAGLAGLCCGRQLQERGVSFQILEAFGGIGGRRKRCCRVFSVSGLSGVREAARERSLLPWGTMFARCALRRCREY